MSAPPAARNLPRAESLTQPRRSRHGSGLVPLDVAVSPISTNRVHRPFVLGRPAATAGLVAVLIAGLGFASGGYFPESWRLATLAACCLTGAALLLLERIELTRASVLFLSALGALAGWIGLSRIWSVSPDLSVLELERALLYLAAGTALALVAGPGAARPLLTGAFAATVILSAYGLGALVVSGRDPDLRGAAIAEPLGYAGALGAIAAVGLLLAALLGVRAGTRAGAAAFASTAALFAPVLYLTTSRAAWLALAVGAIVAILLGPDRLQLAAFVALVAAGAVTAIWLATRLGVDNPGRRSGTARGALPLVPLALLVPGAGAAAAAAWLHVNRQRLRLSPRATRRACMAGAAVTAVALAALTAAGGPSTLSRGLGSGFGEPQAAGTHDVAGQLFTVSGSSRADLWSVALDTFAEHPWLGTGAGTYREAWLAAEAERVRDNPSLEARGARDAHSLPLETLAELGLVGLALILATFALPFAVARKAGPLTRGALAVLAAFLAHAALDWDWELPAVALLGLIAALAAVSNADGAAIPLGRGAKLVVAGQAAAIAITVLGQLAT